MMVKKLLILFLLLLSLTAHALEMSSSLLDAGINDYKKAQYSFAVNNLKKFIQVVEDNTDKPKAYYYLSLSYYFLKNYRMSLHYLNELSARFRLSSYTSQTYFWKGLIYQNLNQYQDAELAFLKYISLMPNSDIIDKAYLSTANSQIAQGKFVEAEANLKNIVDKYKRSDKYEEASVLYAFMLLKNKKRNVAEDFLVLWTGRLGESGKNYKFKDRFWLYLSEIYIDQREYKRAKVLLKKIDNYAQESPSSDIALLRLSQVEDKLGNEEDSTKYLLRLSNEYPQSKYNTDSALSMGQKQFNRENYSKALVFFEETVIVIDKKLELVGKNDAEKKRLITLKANALYYFGETYNKLNDTEKAADYYNRIIDLDDGLKGEAIIRLMELYIKEENISVLNTYIKEYDSYLLAHESLRDNYLLFKAKIQNMNRDYAVSNKTLTLIKDGEDMFEAISNITVINLIKLQELDAAITLLEENFYKVRISKKAYHLLELISLYFTTGKYEKAILKAKSLSAYMDNLPADEQTFITIKADFHVGLSYMLLKSNKKAIALLEKLVKSYNTRELQQEAAEYVNKSFYYLGWLYYKESAYFKAAENFGIAKKLSDVEAVIIDSFYMEAWSYFSNKDFERAIGKFDEIYKAYYPQPIGVKAFYQMAKTYANMDNKSRAQRYYTKIYEEFDANDYQDDALYEIIIAFIRDGNLTEASRLIDEFKKKFPESHYYQSLLMLLAETLTDVGRYSEALSIYSYYIKQYPDSVDIDTVYYWGGTCALYEKDYDTALNYWNIIAGDFPDSIYFINALDGLFDIYRDTKNHKKEEVVLKKLMLVETNEAKREEYDKRLKILAMIKTGVDETEALLISNAKSGDPQAELELALYYYEHDQKHSAQVIFKSLSEENKGNIGAVANLKLADEVMFKRDYTTAVTMFLDTIKLYKASNDSKAQALYKAAYCYNKLGKANYAIKILDKLLTGFPDGKWAEKGRELKERIAQ